MDADSSETLGTHCKASPWIRDVVTGEIALTTTGGKTWNAAHRLCDYLEAEWLSLRLPAAPRVLELGSGTGWLGMTIARNIHKREHQAGGIGPSVLLTEQASEDALEWLQSNLRKNSEDDCPLSAVSIAPLDWTDWEQEDRGGDSGLLTEALHADLVIGSDLVYNEIGVRLLPKVLRSLASTVRHPIILYAHTLHRFDHFDIDFFQALLDCGLRYRAVAGVGDNTAALRDLAEELDPLGNRGEEDFLQELFPEQRIAIFQLLLADSDQPFLAWSPALASVQSSGESV